MKKLLACSLILIASQYSSVAHASTIYTFQGSLTRFSSSVTPAMQSTFASFGVARNQPFTFQIETVGGSGKAIAANGNVTYYPSEETFGQLTYQQWFTSGAKLVSSPFSVPAAYTAYPNEYYARNTTYWSYNFDYGNYGAYLNAGAFNVGKTGDYGDTSVFFQNWVLGETLDLKVHFDDGSHNAVAYDDFSATGTVQLIAITHVPVPAAGWLFASGMAGLVATKRRRAA